MTITDIPFSFPVQCISQIRSSTGKLDWKMATLKLFIYIQREKVEENRFSHKFKSMMDSCQNALNQKDTEPFQDIQKIYKEIIGVPKNERIQKLIDLPFWSSYLFTQTLTTPINHQTLIENELIPFQLDFFPLDSKHAELLKNHAVHAFLAYGFSHILKKPLTQLEADEMRKVLVSLMPCRTAARQAYQSLQRYLCPFADQSAIIRVLGSLKTKITGSGIVIDPALNEVYQDYAKIWEGYSEDKQTIIKKLLVESIQLKIDLLNKKA